MPPHKSQTSAQLLRLDEAKVLPQRHLNLAPLLFCFLYVDNEWGERSVRDYGREGSIRRGKGWMRDGIGEEYLWRVSVPFSWRGQYYSERRCWEAAPQALDTALPLYMPPQKERKRMKECYHDSHVTITTIWLTRSASTRGVHGVLYEGSEKMCIYMHDSVSLTRTRHGDGLHVLSNLHIEVVLDGSRHCLRIEQCQERDDHLHLPQKASLLRADIWGDKANVAQVYSPGMKLGRQVEGSIRVGTVLALPEHGIFVQSIAARERCLRTFCSMNVLLKIIEQSLRELPDQLWEKTRAEKKDKRCEIIN